MDRIATAVELRLTNLERAKASMSRGANDADAAQLSVGADAIGAGVGEAILEKVAAAASRDRRAVAIAALTQLVLHGVAPDAALVRVQEAIARGPHRRSPIWRRNRIRKRLPRAGRTPIPL
jgi:hypothetical protein